MHAPAPTERSFGLSVGSVLAVMAGVLWWRGHPVAPIAIATVAVVLLGGALLFPAALRVPNQLWWRFAQVLGWVNSRIILSVFFYLVLTPAGLAVRMLGRNPLAPVDRDTTWSPYNARRHDPTHYEHPY